MDIDKHNPFNRDTPPDPEPESTDFNVFTFAIKLLSLGIVLAVVWFFRPWFHPIVYNIAYNPFALIAFGFPLILGIILFLAPPLPRKTRSGAHDPSVVTKGKIFGVFFVFFLITGMVIGVAGGLVADRTMAEQAMDDVEFVDEPPEMNEDNPRVAPRAVSDEQTAGSLSYPQHELGSSDISRNADGDLVWSYGLEPDQLRNQFTGNQIGFVHADMTEMSNRQTTAHDSYEFEHGENMRLWDNVDWQLKKQGGFTDGYMSSYQDDSYEMVDDNGDAYIVYPKTGHEWHLTPVPHTTPTWDGVALVSEDGTVEHLSPDEARNDERLDGQRLYPIHNSEAYSESLSYRNGIANTMPMIGAFEDVVEPASMPSGAGNDQPFVVDMEGETMNYMYAMEPAGSGSGLSEIWYFDGETGDMRAYDTGDDTVFGPDRAVGIARGTDTQTDWGEDGQALAVEPILMTVDGDLYWHIKVVTSDQSDVTSSIFVSASESDVGDADDAEEAADAAVTLTSTDEVREFIAGDIDEDEIEDEDGVEIEEPDESDDEDDGVAYYIVILDDNDEEVDRIAVEDEQDTRIETDDGDNDGDDDANE